MLLPADQIQSLHAAAITAQLVDQRETLFANVNKHFVSGLTRSTVPMSQLLLDLHRMNDVHALTDGTVPLESWLQQAVILTTGLPQQAEFEEALDRVQSALELGGRRRGPHEQTGSSPGHRSTAGPSRRRHFLDESPFDFSRPEAQSLWSLLEQNLYRIDDTVEALEKAGISKGRVRLEQPPRTRWHDALAAAAYQGRLRQLVEGLVRDPEWAGLRGRFEELLGEAPAGEIGPRSMEWKAQEPVRGHERLTRRKSRLVDVAFLEKGLECTKSVVRINAFFDGESLTGTGFFIAPGRVLTNHHVLFHLGKKANRVAVWLDYQIRPDGSLPRPDVVTTVGPEIQGQAEYDWATVDVQDQRVQGVPALPLRAGQAVQVGDHVSIIQHPHGLPKKLGIFGSEVRFVSEDVIQYLTDTEQGSSGSPVFNHLWEVVALHNQWTVADMTGGGQEIRNQGVRIDRVVDALSRRNLLA
ncbi:trypsin-like peptidase domain-containing protein [Sorangium sp. So ce296]|uniref:trypsin-like peptidase domain-containing protein n=1 Tax=Sorangium sp. So ce296 TaxID=3133296 RepID=UPI003F62EA80